MTYEKFVRNTIKTLGRDKSRQLFTKLALTDHGITTEFIKDIGRLGLRYLNTGSFKKPQGEHREENNDYK